MKQAKPKQRVQQPMRNTGIVGAVITLLSGMLPPLTNRSVAPKAPKAPAKIYPTTEQPGCQAAKRRLHQPVGERVFNPPTGRLLVRPRGHKWAN